MSHLILHHYPSSPFSEKIRLVLGFIDKAPAPVIDKIKIRRETALADIERINVRLTALPAS